MQRSKEKVLCGEDKKTLILAVPECDAELIFIIQLRKKKNIGYCCPPDVIDIVTKYIHMNNMLLLLFGFRFAIDVGNHVRLDWTNRVNVTDFI